MPSKPPSTYELMDEETSAQFDEEAETRQRRKELIEPTGVKEIFKDGKIKINEFTCVGGQCKICIKACPTNALYWGTGKIGITEDLCVYCGACVLNCMVNDCIKVERKREDGKTECFSKPRDFIMLQERINCQKRFERVRTNAKTKWHYVNKDDSLKKYQNLKQLYIDQEYKI